MISTSLHEMTATAGGPSAEHEYNDCLPYLSAFVACCFGRLKLNGHHGLNGPLFF